MFGRSQQQHSYTCIPGRHKQRRRYSSCYSSSRGGREGRRLEYREVGLQHVVTSIAIRRSAQQDGEGSVWTSLKGEYEQIIEIETQVYVRGIRGTRN